METRPLTVLNARIILWRKMSRVLYLNRHKRRGD